MYAVCLRRDWEGPPDPIEWVRRDQKIRTGCTPRGELKSQQGERGAEENGSTHARLQSSMS